MVVPFVRDFFLDLGRDGALEDAAQRIAQGQRARLEGLTPPAQLLAATLLHRRLRRPAILVVANNRAAEEYRPQLETFLRLTQARAEEPPLVLPAFEIDPYEGLSPHDEILEQQALAQWRLTQGLPLLLLPAVAAATRLASPASYRGLARVLRAGDAVDLEGLAEHLTLVGYRRYDPVEAPGQFSIRGGLLDVYSPEAERPIRIELLGDEIESLREFDPDSQRSVRSVSQAALLPLTSLPPTAERVRRLGELHFGSAGEAADGGIAGTDHPALPPGWEFQIPWLEQFHHSACDLAAEAFVLVLEPDAVAAELERWWKHLRTRYAARSAALSAANVSPGPAPPPPESLFFTPEQVAEMFAARAGAELPELSLASTVGGGEIDLAAERWELRAVPPPELAAGTADSAAPPPACSWPSQPMPRLPGGVARLMEEARARLDAGWRLVFIGANLGEVERLAELFSEYGLPFQLGVRPDRGDDYLTEKSYFTTEAPRNLLVTGLVPRGFALPRQRVALFGTGDLFPQGEALSGVPAPAHAARRGRAASFLSDFRDLAIGDYVVHVEHGVGRYLGLKSLAAEAQPTAAGETGREFMLLEYLDGAKLYVPLTHLDLVQKYRSGGGGGAEGVVAPPPLDRLGGAQWQQRKARVKKAMRDMADELLKLYAARQAIPVRPCGPEDHWQREFEDAFPYAETEDQARAIEDVRRDLAQPRPMDRLVIGDVGYGKTEVAMRAAFKVVNGGRQAALLAPTTVLAFQHYETFKRRFAAFPMAIEMLSRFRTAAQQKDVLARLATGGVDILIGTHRLLSSDVRFRDLGLLVVDEEQRFGVRHKERLKQLKKEVHVLALSATPIPRTLNMSLAGLRDMSVIETPPKDRLAIQTVVAAWDEDLVRAAIETELDRGGQAFVVHNRVETLWEIAALVQRLAPAARVAVAHGQMAESELEKVMLRFVRHEADVLVTTTIIENGLDIPLANTLVVNRADRFGLSELYQLRGRVGRSNRRAYAYLLVPAQTELTPLARKRLAAMREFSDLGAGFKLAALDLELRGAGNLLGGEQSGHIDAVGFDLYVQMLEQTVRELKGEETAGELEPQIQLGVDVRIPAEYVPEENQRLRLYKRLAEIAGPSQGEDVLREMTDRYGPPPRAVRNLLAYGGLKAACRRAGVEALERKRESGGEVLQLRLSPNSRLEPSRIAALAAATPGARLTPDGVFKIPIAGGAAGVALLDQAERLLAAFNDTPPSS